MKILMNAINGIGLGHVTRQLALARALRGRLPDAEFLFLTTSETPGIIWHDGFTSVKIPSSASQERSNVTVSDWLHLNHSLVTATISNFRPDVLIADSFPFGENQELLPAMATIPHKIFIFDYYPGHTVSGNHRGAISNYGLVLVPYEKGEFDLPFEIDAIVEWIGPLIYRARYEALPRAEARRRLGIPEDRLCFYVALGGGGGPELGETVAWLSDIASVFPKLLLFQTIPPLATQESGILTANNARAVSHFPLPFTPYLSTFDGAIVGAGANTVMEIINYGIPAVWIPMGSKTAADQDWRAKKFSDDGLGWAVDRLDSDALSGTIRNMLAADTRHTMRDKMLAQPTPLGAQNGAEIICKWLEK